MRVLTDWLQEFVDVPENTDRLARRLTDIGLEVENVLRLDRANQGVVSAVVREVRSHPERSELKVCELEAGDRSARVVTAAPQVKKEGKYLWAPPGALVDGEKVETTSFAGTSSEGYLCSSRELGLTTEAQTLLELPEETSPGESIDRVLDLQAPILELDLTPNRSDCLSHLGVARDFAAAEGLDLLDPRPEKLTGDADSDVEINIDAPERCWSYTGVSVNNVQVGKSPFKIQKRILKMGLRPLNNVVDITNYVLFEVGHPLHPFDADRLYYPLEIREARPGESLNTLDGESRELEPDDLVIADARRALALAGVMGGAATQVRSRTRRVLLEGAYFEPSGVRRTAATHKLSTEASHRFERGTDPVNYDRCLARCVELLREDAADGEELEVAQPVVCRPKEAEQVRISYDPDCFENLTGYAQSEEQSRRKLEQLGMEVETPAGADWEVEVPGWRADLSRAEDLVEEIVRLDGYENIPVTHPRVPLDRTPGFEERLPDRVRDFFANQGFNENLNFSFIDPDQHNFIPGPEPRQVSNPLARTQATMRQSILDSLLPTFDSNYAAGNEDLQFFEIGKVFPGESDREPRHPGVMIHGHRFEERWDERNWSLDLFDLKGLLEQLLQQLRLGEHSFEADEFPGFDSEESARVLVQGKPVGRLGRVSREFLENDFENAVYAAEVNLDSLPERPDREYEPFSTHPPVKRDLDLVVDRSQPVGPLREEIRDLARWLEELVVFDLYSGDPLPDDKKSVSVRLVFRAPDRSLSDDEVNEVQDEVLDGLAEKFGAGLRDE